MSGEELTKKELKEILNTVLHEIDDDPDDGPRLRAAAAPLRIEFPDLKLVVNVSRDERGRHCLRWDFSRRSKVHPKLRLSMESAVANRVFQGRENPAIAIARGRLHTSIGRCRGGSALLPGREAALLPLPRARRGEVPAPHR